MGSSPLTAAPRAENETSVRVILAAVARELDLIVELGERTQAAFSPLLAESSRMAPEAQQLDALVQHACGLSSFVAAFAGVLPNHWSASPIMAAQNLTLHAQSLRLKNPLSTLSQAPSSGDVELF